MTEHRERKLRIERTYDGPVERVFQAWTSADVRLCYDNLDRLLAG